MSQYLKPYSPFCPIDQPEIVDESYSCITKTFILFDKHINFTGMRDPEDPKYFLLTQRDIYQNGKREIKSLRLSQSQVNDLFYKLENLNTNNSINRILYIC